MALRRFGRLLLVLLAFLAIPAHSAPAAAQTATGFDLVLVIDGSGSILPQQFNQVRLFARQLVELCAVSNSQIGVIQFSTEGATRVESVLTSDKGAVTGAIDAMRQISGLTDIQEGLQFAQTELATRGRPGVEQVIVLLTDGFQEGSGGDPVAQARDIKAAGIDIYGVGVGLANYGELTAIASSPASDYVFRVDDFQRLANVLSRLAGAACGVAEREGEADVRVIQRASPNTTSARNGIVTYTIVASNNGRANSSNTFITLPFDPATVQVVDAVFSRPGAWVSRVSPNSLEIQTGRLESRGDVITATVRLRTLSAAADGAQLGQRLSYFALDDDNGVLRYSNTTALTAGEADRHRDIVDLMVAPEAGPVGTKFTFSSTLFAPGEPVTLWYNTPDNTVKAWKTAVANDEGVLSVVFDTARLPAGFYSMVARGNFTEIVSIVPFEVR
jgi:hypothetical protein